MMKWIYRLLKNFYSFLDSRLLTLITKEANQIVRNKQMLGLLTIIPITQILIYGFSLNPDVQNLKLGIVDQSNSYESRELVAALTKNHAFVVEKMMLDSEEMSQQVKQGAITVGLIFPPDFKQDLAKNETAKVQVLINAVDANTAGIASSYITEILNQFNHQQLPNQVPLFIQPQTTFLYNPGLISSWFFVPGVMGIALTLISSVSSAVTVVREKDIGTLEQILMTPASDWEILLAKIIPLFVLLFGDVTLTLSLGRLIFGLPFRGSVVLFLGLSALYLGVGVAIGILLATFCQTQQQVVLASFFVNLPLIQLSGAIAPVESMPLVFKYLSLLDPLRHYVTIARGILLKGIGLEVLWLNAIALVCCVIVLFSASLIRFRSQLS